MTPTTRALGRWCACTSKLLPVGSTAVWQDGRMHREDTCFDTDDLESFAVSGAE